MEATSTAVRPVTPREAQAWLSMRAIGRALVAAAGEWARSQGCTEFGSDALLDNDASAAAHEALGFTETVQLRCFRKDLT